MDRSLAVGILITVLVGSSALRGAGRAKTPTSADAISACLTLERLASVATDANEPGDVAALYRSYEIVRKYVAAQDGATLQAADAYMSALQQQNPLITSLSVGTPGVAGTGKSSGGFTQDKPEQESIQGSLNGLSTDDAHASAVIVIGKDQSYTLLHSDMNAATVTKTLTDRGAVRAISAAP